MKQQGRAGAEAEPGADTDAVAIQLSRQALEHRWSRTRGTPAGCGMSLMEIGAVHSGRRLDSDHLGEVPSRIAWPFRRHVTFSKGGRSGCGAMRFSQVRGSGRCSRGRGSARSRGRYAR